ncbi:uncharacterized protein [Halyomorpha halys]|uniref:uncharacterized protein isoform X2 n=1 Tax=Halyomorpha halys TaxID=286706 RepID=UPI000D0C75E4|nr:uncharacterized protein LOC106678476 isoform X2 [Halyomorpha halys]
MLTVYYIAATWLQSWRINSILQKIKLVNQKTGTVVVHHELPPLVFKSPVMKQKLEVTSVLSEQCINKKNGNIGDLLWYSSNKRIATIYPKIEKFGIPVAWHAAEYVSLLLESDDLRFASLCVTFSQNNFTLENGIQIMRIQSVDVIGTPYKILNVRTVPETYAPLGPCLNRHQRRESFMSRWRAHISMLCTFCEAVSQVKETQQEISVRHPGSGVGAVKLVPRNYEAQQPTASSSNSLQNSSIIEELLDGDHNSVITEESPIPSSIPSLSRMSTTDVGSTTPVSTRLAADSATTSMSSLRSLPSTPRRTITTNSLSDRSKPPTIVIFSDSSSAADCVKVALETALTRDMYTIHILSFSQMHTTPWLNQTCLVIVHGNVPPSFTEDITNYVLESNGSVLCLCSDYLGSVLPMFHTAEVRPNELVQCSYKSWKHVPLMHHLFCYQPSPSIPQFSHDEQTSLSVIPDSVEVKDSKGNSHKLKVEVLGAEETWQTPSLLLVSLNETAKMVFSQVHLEVDPEHFVSENRDALVKSNKARLEILLDVLGNILGLECASGQKDVDYSVAYFLGNHEVKQDLLDKLKNDGFLENNLSLKAGRISLKFCGKGVSPPPATSLLLPVLMHACPETFSTFDYFENLKTEKIGRLVIFSDVLTTSMDIVQNVNFCHGFTVIPYYQTKGKGRGGNTWLSPKGCAMFSIQIHVALDSTVGRHLPLVQHLVSLAMVTSICQLPGLEGLDIGVKWPNDIYGNKKHKLGGVLVTSTVINNTAICNIGCGMNLKNEEPTVCVHELIRRMNKQSSTNAELISYEKYFANVFNKIEELMNLIESTGTLDKFLPIYYNYWLHSEAEVEIRTTDGESKKAKVKGIDSSGYLLVELPGGGETVVHPDGNTFDMLAGLIVPKHSNS